MTYWSYPSTSFWSPLLTLINLSHNGEPDTTIIGISFYTDNFISSITSNSASPIKMLTILHLFTPYGRFLPSAIFMHKSILKDTSPPHERSLSALLTKKRCVWPFANSYGSTFDGLIFGNFIYFYGAIPISLTPLLRVNF